jgi:hypothetical protein
MPHLKFAAAALALALAATAVAAAAQELEPRAYSASPVGANFMLTGYGYSFGELIFDPSVPVTDVHANINSIPVGYGRTFSLFGLQALATAALAYSWGTLRGVVGTTGVDSQITRSGLGDLKMKLSVNLIGSPALTPTEFAQTPPKRFVLGASVAAVAPTGQYDSARLINIGANRWAFKPEIGASYNLDRKLYLDLYAGVWLFADNTTSYPGGATRSQDPLYSIQAHVSYNLDKRLWGALDGTYYFGGATHQNGGSATARQDNSRVGALLTYAIAARQQLKLNYTVGATARVGSKFQTLSLGYQVLWF